MCFPKASARFLVATSCLASLTGCDRHGLDFVVAPEFDDTFTFEFGLADWTARGRDLTNPTDLWEVVPSSERASDGSQSVRLRLENVNSQGKIWIERKYSMEADQLYTVYVAFDLGTADFGSANLWQIVAGAAPTSPAAAGVPAPQGDTGNGQATDQGYKFVRKTYTTEARSDADGNLYVYVGVWGTSPFARSYCVDKVKVVLTRKGLSKKL